MLKNAIALATLLCAATVASALEVNKATPAELDGLNGVGPATSKRILDERNAGPYKNWGDLIDRVRGIGPHLAEKLSGQGVTVNGELYKSTAMTKAKATEPASKEAKK
ncbi:ComEA family DNA-binding protein [Ramlibacter rhizophilus]|uniref:Helix-hairpin-helix domain-containing protein n=1 Tax=Ramlibacter rhizophilus TaxID=1781167 RepID=A0A4Z0BCK2_9BURK|nr:helix-hairpin-helix domain-containing protein [Ramlibacter rhizophilus]TFY96985.1 helix-hairpin-helix domain-containing protein [Ramlibacter rhizophilus]